MMIKPKFLLLLLCVGFLISCQKSDASVIKELFVSVDFITQDATSPYDFLNFDFSSNDFSDTLVITVNEDYRLDSRLKLYINKILIPFGSYTVNDQVITCDLTDHLDNYKVIDFTIDLNGGALSSTYFSDYTADETLEITSKNNTSYNGLMLADSTVSSLRWHYKLFLKYNEFLACYEVVYRDQATKSVLDLNVLSYDLIIALPTNTQDIDAREIMIFYTDPSFDDALYIIFDEDFNFNDELPITLNLFKQSTIDTHLASQIKHPKKLPTPYKDGFTFIGWSYDEEIYTNYPGFKNSNPTSHIAFRAIWEGATMEDLLNYLNDLIPSEIHFDLVLPSSFSQYTLSYSSSHPGVLSASGQYKRPYQETFLTLTIHIESEEVSESKAYFIKAFGYKSLQGPIASSYIYRNYQQVDDLFFETLDIINCAFMTAQSDGSITGNAVLSNILTHIMPKAKIHGNWVILSIAPESQFSVIAQSQTLMNTFANHIVSLINTHGFDGVDIDWETPKSHESTRYTQLMKIVYEKVKANNPNHLVTTAITGGMWQPPMYDLLNSNPYIDYINMMTYGMVSNGAQYQNALFRSTSFHHPTFSAGRTLISCSIDESIDIFHQNYAIPLEKIIVGVAFYGIRQTRTYQSSTQSWSAWVNAGSIFYTTINQSVLNNSNYKRYFDHNAGVPYIIRNDGTEFISYDDRTSILLKSQYIYDNNLGGMMFWEYGTDSTNTLMYALKDGLNKG